MKIKGSGLVLRLALLPVTLIDEGDAEYYFETYGSLLVSTPRCCQLYLFFVTANISSDQFDVLCTFQVVGDGIYIPATDDDMKTEDLIDHKSSLQFVLENSQPAICSSNDDTFGQEFPPIDCEGLFSSVFQYYFPCMSLYSGFSAGSLLGFVFINVIALFFTCKK